MGKYFILGINELVYLKMLTSVAFVAFATFGLGSTAQSAPVTFFGENTSGSVVGDPSNAQSSFLASLSTGVGTEDFETGALPSVDFAGTTGMITATLSGSGVSIESSPGNGRFATSGNRYVETGSGSGFSISFSTGISAFGFFGTDIGDFGNELILGLTNSNGNTSSLNVGNTVGDNGSTDGSVLFFGFVDTANAYTNISFDNVPGGIDVFGFDDLTIGDTGQIVNPPAVPLPASSLLLIGGLAGFAAIRRRKTS